ncbi:MAG: hypothetical protein HC875_17025 [Anaerolineales bacterium]|nr:hypothetical protein [Anaerolineales bacterium]
MKYLIIFSIVISSFILPPSSFAQSPEPTPDLDLPYHFEPVDFDENAAPDLPLPSVTTPDFINKVGSYALTVFSLLDKYQVLGIFVVIMLGLSCLWWLYSFVTDRPVLPTLNVSGGLDMADQVGDAYFDDQYRRAEATFDHPHAREQAFSEIADVRGSFKENTRKIKKLVKYF